MLSIHNICSAGRDLYSTIIIWIRPDDVALGSAIEFGVVGWSRPKLPSNAGSVTSEVPVEPARVSSWGVLDVRLGRRAPRARRSRWSRCRPWPACLSQLC